MPLRDGCIAQCETLVRLFEGPIGSAHVGRLRTTAAETLVLLRHVSPLEVESLAEIARQLQPLSHPAVGKVLGLVHEGTELYLASEYIHGLTLLELLQRRVMPAGVAMRILHDAIQVADGFAERRGDATPGRYLYADTVWVTLRGTVMLSEPVVAGVMAHVAPASLTRARRSFDSLGHDDTQALSELAQQVLAHSIGLSGRDRSALRAVLTLEPSHADVSRSTLMANLASLPEHLFASQAAVAEHLHATAGAELDERRLRLRRADSFAPQVSLEEETACVDVAALRAPRPPALSSLPRRSSAVAPDVAPDELLLNPAELWLSEPEEDPQEVTAAFRPSDLPRLLARASASKAEPESDPPLVEAVPASEAVARTVAEALAAVHSPAPASSSSVAAASAEFAPQWGEPSAAAVDVIQPAAPDSNAPSSSWAPTANESEPIALNRIANDDADINAELKRAQWRRLRAVFILLVLVLAALGSLVWSTYG